jgi:hypothetical protein
LLFTDHTIHLGPKGTIRKWLDRSSVNPDLPLVYTPVNVDMLKLELAKHADRKFVNNLCNGLTFRFNTVASVLYLSISLVFIVLVLPKLACWFTWFSLGQKAEECIVELHKLHEFILALLRKCIRAACQYAHIFSTCYSTQHGSNMCPKRKSNTPKQNTSKGTIIIIHVRLLYLWGLSYCYSLTTQYILVPKTLELFGFPILVPLKNLY